MNLHLYSAFGLILASSVAFGACAASDDNSGGGAAGAGGTGAKDGSIDAPGTGGSSATGGSGGTTGGQGGTSGSGGASGAAGEAGSDSGTGGVSGDGGVTTITGHIMDLLTQQTGIPGATVCIYDDASVPCVTTDSTGTYSIGPVPAGAELLLKYTKSGYFPALVTVRTSPGLMDIGDFPAPTNDEANAFAAYVGTTLDLTKGQVLGLALTGSTGGFSGQDGVTASITPVSGSGPYYTSASGFPDTNLTYTSTSGAALFANVNPGDIDVDFVHPTKTCQRYTASWIGTKSTSARVKIVAGYVTGGAALVCP